MHVFRVLCIAAVLGLALTSFPPPTFAQLDENSRSYAWCMGNCSASVDCRRPAGNGLYQYDGGCVTACYDRCKLMYKSAPLPPAPYGAFAFGDQGAEGISWNQTAPADADRVAIANCSKYGSNCKLVSRYTNQCGALAKSADERHFEVGTGNNEQEAQANAVGACQKRWGKCSSDLSHCSFADRHQPPPPPRAISWGAIAFSAADGQAGWSQARDDRASAEQEALRVCSQRGKGCVVMTAFNKQCAGLARDGHIAGTAVAADQQVALQQAQQACAKNGGARCVIQVLFCSR
jgi:hypothetical protein